MQKCTASNRENLPAGDLSLVAVILDRIEKPVVSVGPWRLKSMGPLPLGNSKIVSAITVKDICLGETWF